jgi:serine/threonine-protein kinase
MKIVGHSLLELQVTQLPPGEFLVSLGQVFAVFDELTQDSGNISYGALVQGKRYFLKTAGAPDDPKPPLSHRRRMALLGNAARFRRTIDHPCRPELLAVIESPHGPMLVYVWVDGELLYADRPRRSNPESPFQRFRSLPGDELLGALDVVFDFHRQVAEAGWVASDFYDGSMMYDFVGRSLRLIDLDMYHEGPFTNESGRMFGSTRFMAPEEFERGAVIDEVTNVFTMGRVLDVFLPTVSEGSPFYSLRARACQQDRKKRFPTMGDFHAAWLAAREGAVTGILKSNALPTPV